MIILQISNKSPFPPIEGGPIAMSSVIDGLIAEGHEVDVLTMSTPKFRANPNTIPEAMKSHIRLVVVDIDSSVKLIPALMNLLSHTPYHVSRFRSTAFSEALENILQSRKHDIIQVESPMLANYLPLIRRLSTAPVIMRAHNIEYRIWERLIINTKNPIYKAYLKIQTRRLRRHELNVWKQVDGIAAITVNDARFISSHTSKPVVGIPFGIRPVDQLTKHSGSSVSLCHIGSMDWLPNLEGIRWFINECWPAIHNRLPELKLHLAGRNFPHWLSQLEDQGIIGLGEVSDAKDFLNRHQILVVPLLSGSGIRIKIIEGMAMGKAVVTTSVGAEGIDVIPDVHLKCANNAEEFINAVIELATNGPARQALGTNARQLIRRRYSLRHTTEQFMGFYNRLLGQNSVTT